MSAKASAAATDLARWGYSRGSAQDLARAYGVSPSRASHMRTDEAGTSELANLLRIVMDAPEDLARGIKDAVERAWERRPLQQAPTAVLCNRLNHLWHKEHDYDAEEDRQAALCMATRRTDEYREALVRHAGVQTEIDDLIAELEWRGVDIVAVIRGDD